MARLIDAMQTVTKLSARILPLIRMGANPTQIYNEMLQVLAEAPTVDAVEVVRCKGCLFYNETIGKDSGKPCGYGSCRVPGHITGIVYDEDFCSYGERKDNGC